MGFVAALCQCGYPRPVLALCLSLVLSDGLAREQPEQVTEAGRNEAQGLLDQALEAYFEDRVPEAEELLVRLLSAPDAPPELVREARLWLGEIQHQAGDLEAARSSFRAVLLEDGEARIDPFEHPPEVVAFFDSVRAEVQAEQRIDPRAARGPLPPAWAFMTPGGMQFHNGRPGLGLLTASSVTLGALTVGVSNRYLASFDDDPNTFGIQIHVDDASDTSREQQLERIRSAQWGVATVTGGIWLGSTLGGLGRATRPGQPVTLSAAPGHVGLTLRW